MVVLSFPALVLILWRRATLFIPAGGGAACCGFCCGAAGAFTCGVGATVATGSGPRLRLTVIRLPALMIVPEGGSCCATRFSGIAMSCTGSPMARLRPASPASARAVFVSLPSRSGVRSSTNRRGRRRSRRSTKGAETIFALRFCRGDHRRAKIYPRALAATISAYRVEV